MADEILDVFTPNWPDISSAAATWADIWWGGLPKPVIAGSRTQSDQWLRRMELIVYQGMGSDASSPEDGLSLSNLRVNFQVKKMTSSSPNILYARIYNLSPQTMKRVKAFSRVALSAGYWGSMGDPAIYKPASESTVGGYGGNYGMIFDGTVVLYIQGKENAVDTYLDIWAGDGDKPRSAGMVNMTFPIGTKLADKTEKIAREGFKIEVGKVKIAEDRASVRAETVIGMAEPQLRKIANQSDSHFWIDSNKFFMVPYIGYASDIEITLKPTTGLIGMPLVQPDGIQAQCLLNPKLRLGGRLKIDIGLLSNVPFLPGSDSPWWTAVPSSPNPHATGPTQKWAFAPTSPEGTYKILLLEHHGDNRGQNWYSNITAMAVGEGTKYPTAYSRSAIASHAAETEPADKPIDPETSPMNNRVRALALRLSGRR